MERERGNATRYELDSAMSELQQGMVLAAAILASSHGEVTYAEEILAAASPINWREIDVYDRTALKKAGIKLKKFA